MDSSSATWNRDDRDLLVELRTTLKAVQDDIKEIKDGTSSRLDTLEASVNTLKTWRSIQVAFIGLLTLVLVPIVAAFISAGKL